MVTKFDGDTARWSWLVAVSFPGAFLFRRLTLLQWTEYLFWSTFLVDLSPMNTDATLVNQICAQQVLVEHGVWGKNQAFIRITNTKVFLAAYVGFNSWSGRMEVLGYEMSRLLASLSKPLRQDFGSTICLLIVEAASQSVSLQEHLLT
jgi:hypothetical protein